MAGMAAGDDLRGSAAGLGGRGRCRPHAERSFSTPFQSSATAPPSWIPISGPASSAYRHSVRARRVSAEPDVGCEVGPGDVRVNAARSRQRPSAPRVAKRKAPPPCQLDVLGDPTLLALDDLDHARRGMAAGMVPHLDPDPAAAHLVRHGRRGAGAEEGVENEVAGVGGDVQDALHKAFRLRSCQTDLQTLAK